MPEDLKINVGVGGAAEAAAALKAVAGAEKAVGQAAGEGATGLKDATKAKTDAGEAADELRMRHMTLLRQMAMLSPECAIMARALNDVMGMSTGTGLALSLLGVAIGAVAVVINRASAAEVELKKRAEEVSSALTQQRDAYLTLQEAAEKTYLAQERHGRPRTAIKAQGFNRLNADIGAGEVDVLAATEAAVAGGTGLTTDQAASLLMWQGLGYGERYKTAGARRRGFGQFIAGEGAGERLRTEWAAHVARASEVVEENRRRSALALAGPGGEARALAGLSYEAAQNRQRGVGPATVAELEEELADLTFAAGQDYWGAREALGRRLQEHPELAGLRVRSRRFSEKWDPRNIGATITMAQPGEEGTPIAVYGNVHQGGVQVYNQSGVDRAGAIGPNRQR